MIIIGVILLVIVAVVCFAIGFGLGEDSERKKADEHECDYQIVGSRQMYNVRVIHGVPVQPKEDGEPITVVLYRCAECGNVTTEDLSGHWTLAQLQGVEPNDETNEIIESESPTPAVEEESKTAAQGEAEHAG